jgi:hypothetical protein
MDVEEAADRHRLEPRGPQREGNVSAVEQRRDEWAARGDEDVLRERCGAAHGDLLAATLDRLGSVGPSRRQRGRIDLLPEEVG